MRRLRKRRQELLALASREVELSWRVIHDVRGYDAVNLLPKRLNADYFATWVNASSFACCSKLSVGFRGLDLQGALIPAAVNASFA